MGNWVTTLVLLLRLIDKMTDWMSRKGFIQQGVTQQIARELANIAKSAKASAHLRQELKDLTDEELDSVLTSD